MNKTHELIVDKIALKNKVDGLSPADYAALYASLSDDHYSLGNLVVHKAISPNAMSFIPPLGESYVRMNMIEDIDVDFKGMFTIMSDEFDTHQLGCFHVSDLRDDRAVYRIDLDVVGGIITVPTVCGYLVESLIISQDGKYERPKTKSLWD